MNLPTVDKTAHCCLYKMARKAPCSLYLCSCTYSLRCFSLLKRAFSSNKNVSYSGFKEGHEASILSECICICDDNLMHCVNMTLLDVLIRKWVFFRVQSCMSRIYQLGGKLHNPPPPPPSALSLLHTQDTKPVPITTIWNYNWL